MRIEITILVEPTPKGRPRFGTTKAGKRYTYTPDRTAHAEALIREALIDKGYFDKHIPLRIEATFYRPKPKSLPKKVNLPVAKPDLSNLLKTLEDALEKFVFANDSQITTAVIRKRFGVPPRIHLILEMDSD